MLAARIETEDSFLAGVYRASAWVWAAGLVVCLLLRQWPAAVGWTIGSGVSCGVLRSLEIVIRRTFVPHTQGARRDLARYSLVKLAIVSALLCGLVLLGGRSFALVLGFCAGVGLAQGVIVAKTFGALVSGAPRDRQGA